MKGNIKKYHTRFLNLIGSIEVSDSKGKRMDFCKGIETACDIVKNHSKKGGKIFFIGNGGSAAIASHMAIDFWRTGSIPSVAFTDNSLLTCISNDFGFENVFAKPIEFFARKNDILFAISSSGKSKNIIRAVETMKKQGGSIITLSGFEKNNPLHFKGICNFYVSSCEYGLVEVIHQYICHFILDTIVNNKLLR